jgi:hypothetical protein
MLICYILAELRAPMRFDQLHEVMEERELVNYFELVRAVDGLRSSGHLAMAESGDTALYAVTPLGIEMAGIFETTLPPALRERSLAAADRLLKRQRRLKELSVEIEPSGAGYQMRFAIPEEGEALLSFSLFAATMEDCERMRRRFLNDPVFIYRAVTALLTGDERMLEGVSPVKEQLF